MAREIHDTLAQTFAGIILQAQALRASVELTRPRSRKALAQLLRLAHAGLEDARGFVEALRPRVLEDASLPAALQAAARQLAEGAGVVCAFRQRGAFPGLAAAVQDELFRIAQEALANIARHARARSAAVMLECRAASLTLTLRDDGVGLAERRAPGARRGYGLAIMRERAASIGARLEISGPANGGTCVRVRLPLRAKRRAAS
ncbi:MAG: histidine kinase [Verrucomicrobiota bacterium]